MAKEKRTYASRRLYNIRKTAERRRRLKVMVVEYLGGKCIRCGYNKCVAALEAHHRDPATKSFALALSGLTKSWARIKAEADKCDLLCANCHREKHDEEHKANTIHTVQTPR